MTMRNSMGLALLLLVGVLAGCDGGADADLQQWMAEQRATARPKITPLSEPKVYEPQAYRGDNALSPFDASKLTTALRRESAQSAAGNDLILAEQRRRKDELEAFPLDVMRMVGSLNKKGEVTALLKVDNLLYQVRVGNYLGQSYGRITRITENSIQLREIVQDAAGEWVEKSTTLDLQEGSK